MAGAAKWNGAPAKYKVATIKKLTVPGKCMTNSVDTADSDDEHVARFIGDVRNKVFVFPCDILSLGFCRQT